MSTKIELRIQKGIDIELLDQGIMVRLIRLITRVRLKTGKEWTRTSEAILDTGCAVSLIPYSIWLNADFNLLWHKDIALRGLAPQKEAVIQAKIAEVEVILHDRYRISPSLKIKSYLLTDDRIPLIIGFEGILTMAEFVCNYKDNIAYLMFDT